MDPLEILGLPPSPSPDDVTAAYRRLAKEWHPDRRDGAEAAARMAEINSAYDLLRAAAWNQQVAAQGRASPATRTRPATGGAWLPPAIRSALGRELLGVLEPHEEVWLVTPATTWASPEALLAASDRRLLWLLDDAVMGRVHTLRFSAIEAVEHSVRRPLRRVATLRLHARNGRRHTFGDLRPTTAATLAARIRGAAAGAARTA